MNPEEYKKRRAHLGSINVQIANCDPSDELEALRERFIEERTSELMEGLYQDPERMQEYILESHYENTNMLAVCGLFGDMMLLPSTKNVIDFLSASGTFFEEAVTNVAMEEEQDL